MNKTYVKSLAIILGALSALSLCYSLLGLTGSEIFVLSTISMLTFQGLFFTIAMLYSWKDPTTIFKVSPPKLLFGKPSRTFSLIIPVRHEEKVIGQTISALSKIKYPEEKLDIIIVARYDDIGTIDQVNLALERVNKSNIKLILTDGFPINKASSLNFAIKSAKGQFIGIFDAEDEPHADLLQTVDVFLDHNPETDVVQSAVQLVNLNSSWFSALNCLEYYFWFKSVLPLFSSLGATPLGGNSVFFKRSVLNQIDGWDEQCLTEDAEIGIRLSSAGFKTSIIYDQRLATLEETPQTADAFIKQRARWIQGYLQTIGKGDWTKQKNFKQRFLSLSLLFQPVIHEILSFLFLLGPLTVLVVKVPLILTMISFIPLYFLLLQWGCLVIGLNHISKNYNVPIPKALYLNVVVFYFPYQFLVSLAFIRALHRIVLGNFDWEKTAHFGLHRTMPGPTLAIR